MSGPVKWVQLVPAAPGPAGGVTSYAAALGRALAGGVGGTMPSMKPHSPRQLLQDPEVPASTLVRGADDLARLEAELASGSVRVGLVIHYSNYGFQSRGCPLWLAPGLARLKASRSDIRLLTVFHEVFATGAPWRSSFWLSPIQRRIAGRIARLSDALVTSLPLYARLLGRWVAAERIRVLPVFSTVGEIEEPLPARERPPCLVVFGGAGNRARVYRQHRRQLEATCSALGFEEIWDVGPPVQVPASAGRATIRPFGVRPAAEVSALMEQARAGLLAYPAAFLSKSTAFAAYAAHGLVPICAGPRHPRNHHADLLEPGEHYLSAEGLEASSVSSVEAVARTAHDWYRGHCLARQAEAFDQLARGEAPRS